MRTNWYFRPKPVNTVLTIIALIVFSCLGIWQVERASEKRSIHNAFVKASDQLPINIMDITSSGVTAPGLAWRKVAFSGEYIENSTIILDNQVYNGVAGYHVLSGFRPGGSDRSVLINRGWVAAGKDRNDLGPINSPRGHIDLAGRVYFPQDNWFVDEAIMEHLANGVIRIQEINIDVIKDQVNVDLFPFILLLDADAGPGFSRVWRVPDNMDMRHQGYAFQWFMMAVAVLSIYVITNLKKIDTHE